MTARTYLWMFPIYGMVVLFEPVHDAIRHWPFWERGIVWMALSFTVEYSAGLALSRLIGRPPWDYSHAALNVNGLIRLDYAPAWFVAGFLFEQIHDWLDQIMIFSGL